MGGIFLWGEFSLSRHVLCVYNTAYSKLEVEPKISSTRESQYQIDSLVWNQTVKTSGYLVKNFLGPIIFRNYFKTP